MDAQIAIMLLGGLQVLLVIALAGAGFALASTARSAGRRASAVSDRARRLGESGRGIATSAGTKGLSIFVQSAELREHIARKWATTRRLVHQATHPEEHLPTETIRQIDAGQRWTTRLFRLSAAARKAAGQEGSSRPRS